MPADRPALHRRLKRLRRRVHHGKPAHRMAAALAADLEASIARRLRRRERLPAPEYPEALPVTAHREALKRAIAENQVVVVAGETGSGKTTQLPKICLELGRGVAGMIGHTQPRRIAARSVAARIAAELRTEVGRAVGYQVRFTDRVGPDTYIKLMTDGILLAETQGDRDLLAYDTLIIDEAHERTLNIDFLLGYVKRLLPCRPDLKVIITSATIDTARFARHFDGAPVVEVSGRSYPVEVRYRPLEPQAAQGQDGDLAQAIVDAVDEISRIDRGDILVFLPGERDIREAADALRKRHPPETEILALFARLSVAEQNRVFQPHGGRRIVLATNVAETSLTVPGIRYVIDPGHARVSRYSHRSKVQRLPVEKVSRASCDQRAGRCGRVAPGVCIRLYSEDDYLSRPPFTDSEIRRTNLAAVILRMLDLGLGEVGQFPFVDPPDKRYINDGYRLLHELGAVDEARALTRLGRELARLPVDPRIGRMILAARDLGCLHEALIIASALTVQDPRERPLDAREQADAARAGLADERSDFLSFLNLWRFFHEQARHLSKNKLRKLCQGRFLAFRRMHEWHDLHQQLANQVKDMGMRLNEAPADAELVHRALLAGLIGNIGFRGEQGEYQGSHGKRFYIFPGSTLAKKGPKWVMAAELVETARLFARTVAGIKPEWVERQAPHLVRRHYLEPHWEKRAGQVIAYEQVTLYGLTLVARRKVRYGPIDPQQAREIFIHRALVEGELDTRAAFFRHNRRLVQELHGLEDKARRRDIVADEQVLFELYDRCIPEGIHGAKAFEKWREQAEGDDPRLLFVDREALLRRDAEGAVTEARFPDRLTVEDMVLPLAYRFEPGHEADGVSVDVPVGALNALEPRRFEWLVPGLLEEKITALIKTLPKALRRNFVPAPDFARACAQALGAGRGPLLEALSSQLQRMSGVEVALQAWDPARLPDHLRMRFRVLDEQGRVLGAGRDLARLQDELGERARASLTGLRETGLERDEVSQWDFGELPQTVELRRGGMTLRGFPALVEEGGGVALRVLDTPERARTAMGAGLRRLFMITHRAEVQYLRKNLPGIQQMCLRYAAVGGCEALKDDLVAGAVEAVLLEQGADIRSREAFDARCAAARPRLVAAANELCARAGRALAEYHGVAKAIQGAIPPAWLQAAADIREQLDHLVYPGFAREADLARLDQYPRYLKAIRRRLDRLDEDWARDRRLEQEIRPHWRRYLEHRAGRAGDDGALEHYRWMVEELRVSLFAQELGTACKVSAKRLDAQWQAVVEGGLVAGADQ